MYVCPLHIKHFQKLKTKSTKVIKYVIPCNQDMDHIPMKRMCIADNIPLLCLVGTRILLFQGHKYDLNFCMAHILKIILSEKKNVDILEIQKLKIQ